MSIECLNDDERATYFLGLAVRRQMEEARDNFASSGKSDPKSKKAFSSIFRWTKRWLPPDKIDNISASTGYLIRKEFQRELSPTSAQGRKFNPVKASTDAWRFVRSGAVLLFGKLFILSRDAVEPCVKSRAL